MDTLTYVLITLIATVWFYPYVFPRYPDIHPAFLTNQSSISNIKHSGETAVYRSKVTPHGRSLMTGLAIRGSTSSLPSGSSSASSQYLTRDGSIADIWQLALESSKWDRVLRIEGQYAREAIDHQIIKKLVYGLGHWLHSFVVSSSPANKDIVVLSANGVDALVIFFAAALFGFSIVFVPIEDPSKIVDAIYAINPLMVFAPSRIIEKLDTSRIDNLKKCIVTQYLEPFKTKTAAAEDLSTLESSSAFSSSSSTGSALQSTLLWKELKTQISENANAYFGPSEEGISHVPVKCAFFDADDDEIHVNTFSQKNIVSAIAAQIKTLPASQQWTSADVVLTYCSSFDMYTLLCQLVALVHGSSLVFVEPFMMIYHPLKIIEDIRPTVMITEELSSYSLVAMANDMTLIRQLKLYLARRSLVKSGILPGDGSQPVIPEFRSLRLIHCGIYRSSSFNEDPCLSTEEVNIIRALTGSRIVHAIMSPVSLSPLAQTNVYDYRESTVSKYAKSPTRSSLRQVNFGSPLPCLEAKLVDYKNLNSRDRAGVLYVRGPAITQAGGSPDTDGWINTKLTGCWATDGCFKFIDE